tara:strand:+ start:249 stop:542 length:294 start_codon:yes stop_codon:yes gene_type:complete
MLIRRCSQGKDIAIYKNTKPGMKKDIELADATMIQLTYPSAAKDYFVLVDGAISKRSDSFETCENYYIDICQDKCGQSHGRIDIVKHKLVNNKVTVR